MRGRTLLLCSMLVAVALMAFGCSVNVIPNPDGGEKGEVNTVVRAFMDALEDQNGFAMKGLLASYVTSENHVDWVGVQEGLLLKEAFASTWTRLLPDREIGVRALQFVHGPSTTIAGGRATSTGSILLTLDHPADWFNDWRLEIVDTYPVEDIHSVRLDLEKVGFSWKVTSFTLYEGERQRAFREAWATFAEGFHYENVDTMLSVCANPFYWTGVPGYEDVFDLIGTHYEWRDMLPEFFEFENPKLMSLAEAIPIELGSTRDAFRIRVQTGTGESFWAEASMVNIDGKWLLSDIRFF